MGGTEFFTKFMPLPCGPVLSIHCPEATKSVTATSPEAMGSWRRENFLGILRYFGMVREEQVGGYSMLEIFGEGRGVLFVSWFLVSDCGQNREQKNRIFKMSVCCQKSKLI